MLYANQEVIKRKDNCEKLFYSDVQEEALEAQVVLNGGSGGEGAAGGSAFYSYAVLSAGFYHTFLLKHLLPGIDQLPENVDPGRREEFLTDAEFLEVSSNQSFLPLKTYL